MIYLIEGPDGTGKTKKCKELSDSGIRKTYHATLVPKNVNDFIVGLTNDFSYLTT